MFCADEVVECSALRELNLTAGEMLKRKAVSDRVTWIGAEQQIAIADLQRKVKYYEVQAAHRSTLVSSERKRGDKGDRAGSSGNGSEVDSSKEPKKKFTGRNSNCRCLVAQYVKRLSGL